MAIKKQYWAISLRQPEAGDARRILNVPGQIQIIRDERMARAELDYTAAAKDFIVIVTTQTALDEVGDYLDACEAVVQYSPIASQKVA